MIIIEVNGSPAPQGSKRHAGNGRMVEMSKAVGPWREAVRAETQRAYLNGGLPFPPLDGPLEVRINFRLSRPKSTPKKVLYPFKRPDLDKLARAVLDGLTDGGAWNDDGQVVTLLVTKRFAWDAAGPGCSIQITPETDTGS